MGWLISIFADNPIVVALANFGGAAAFLYLIITRGAKIASFVIDAQRQSIKAARRRKNYRLARTAFNCAECPSTLIAMIIKQFLLASVIMLAIASMMLVNFSPTTGVDSTPQLASRLNKITAVASGVMFAIMVSQLFTYFSGLSGAVIAINQRKRLSRIGAPAHRRRVRVISI